MSQQPTTPFVSVVDTLSTGLYYVETWQAKFLSMNAEPHVAQSFAPTIIRLEQLDPSDKHSYAICFSQAGGGGGTWKRYLCFADHGEIELRDSVGPWETLRFDDDPSYPGMITISCPSQQQRFLRCDDGGGVNSRVGGDGPWEHYRVTRAPPSPAPCAPPRVTEYVSSGQYFIQTWHGGYVSYHDSGFCQLFSPTILELERIAESGDYSLSLVIKGVRRYVCFADHGNLELQTAVGPWETLRLVDHPDYPGMVGIHCPDRGKFLHCNDASGLGYTTAAGPWEQFRLIRADHQVAVVDPTLVTTGQYVVTSAHGSSIAAFATDSALYCPPLARTCTILQLAAPPGDGGAGGVCAIAVSLADSSLRFVSIGDDDRCVLREAVGPSETFQILACRSKKKVSFLCPARRKFLACAANGRLYNHHARARAGDAPAEAQFALTRVTPASACNALWPLSSQWMHYCVDDETACSDVSVPGTHDTASLQYDLRFEPAGPFAACQTLSITQQLLIGVRFLDVRMYKDDEEDGGPLRLTHGAIGFDTTFAGAVAQIRLFLAMHPSEMVFLSIKNDRDAEITADDLAAVPWFVDALVRPSDNITVGECRGRVLLINRIRGTEGSLRCITARIADDGFTPPASSAEPAPSSTPSPSLLSSAVMAQDVYSLALDDWPSKVRYVEEGYRLARQSEGRLYLNFTSCTGTRGAFGIPFPSEAADRINPRIVFGLQMYHDPSSHRVNILAMDFVQPHIAAAVIRLNRRRTAPSPPAASGALPSPPLPSPLPPWTEGKVAGTSTCFFCC